MDDSTKVPDSFDSRDVLIADLEKQLAAALKRIAQLEDLINRLQRGGKRQAAGPARHRSPDRGAPLQLEATCTAPTAWSQTVSTVGRN